MANIPENIMHCFMNQWIAHKFIQPRDNSSGTNLNTWIFSRGFDILSSVHEARRSNTEITMEVIWRSMNGDLFNTITIWQFVQSSTNSFGQFLITETSYWWSVWYSRFQYQLHLYQVWNSSAHVMYCITALRAYSSSPWNLASNNMRFTCTWNYKWNLLLICVNIFL